MMVVGWDGGTNVTYRFSALTLTDRIELDIKSIPHQNPQNLSLSQAVKYYGPLVDKVASKYGISGSALLAKLVKGESGGNPNAVSKAGARGLTQFMPGVRQAFLDKYGVDAYRSPGEAVYAATLHLRGKLGHGVGLEGYNPGGGQSYVNYILGQNASDISKSGSEAPRLNAGYQSPGTTGDVGNAGQHSIQTSYEQIGDPAAARRVEFANYLQRVDPGSGLLRMGVVDPNEPTTRTQTTTTDVTPSVGSSGGRAMGGSGRALPLNSNHTANFEGKQVAAWIKPVLEYARSQGWKGQVNSGFRSFAEQTRIYNSGVRPAARPGTSNHEGAQFPRGAVDVSDAAQLSSIISKSKYAHLLQWAGNKDPVHFSHPHNGSY